MPEKPYIIFRRLQAVATNRAEVLSILRQSRIPEDEAMLPDRVLNNAKEQLS